MIGTLYRPPSSDISLINDGIYSVIEAITRKYHSYKVFLTGNLNTDLLKVSESKLTAGFYSIMCSYGFFPFIVRLTRVTSHSASILDHIWCNEPDTVRRSGINMNDITDHFPISVDLKISSDVYADAYLSFQKRVINERNKTVFKELVYRFDWNTVITDHDPESSFNPLYEENT